MDIILHLLHYAVAAFTGGVTGYVTNDYAVKMIFKKYGPFGGMIIKTREQFVENVSRMVERDIINHRTMEQELSKYEFRRVFYNLIADILRIHLYNNTRVTHLAEIPGMEESMNQFLVFYHDHAGENIEKILPPLLNQFLLENLFGERQRLFLANKLWELFLHQLTESSVLETAFTDFLEENKDRPLETFASPRLCKIMAENLTVHTKNLHGILQSDYGEEVDVLLQTMFATLGSEAIIEKIIKSIKAKTLADLLGQENTDRIANEILERGIALMRSPEGKVIIQTIAVKGIDLLKSLHISILSILDDSLRSSLEKYLRDNLPGIVEGIIQWVKSNQTELDDLINRSIDDVLEEESSHWHDFRGKVKKTLKKAFYENISRKYEVVHAIIVYIEQVADVKTMSIEATNALLHYIEHKTVSEIVCDLEKKKLLSTDYLASLLTHNIDRHIDKIQAGTLAPFFHTPINILIADDFAQPVYTFVKNILIDKVKTEFLFSPRMTGTVQQTLREQILKLCTEPIGRIVDTAACGDMARQAKNYIVNQLALSKSQVIQCLAREIYRIMAAKNVGDFCQGGRLQKISGTLAGRSLDYLHARIAAGQNYRVNALYDKLNAQKDLIKNLTGLALELSNDNLALLLDGKIQQAVSGNLSGLPDTTIQSMVEDFMGKELKPINRFGAILGSVTGLLTALLESRFSFLTASGVAFLVYGFIGWITNVIALKMIFQPYEEKRFFGIKMPFTPGVVSRQKHRFAASMAEFVDTSLLSAESVQSLFQEKRRAVEEHVMETVSAQDYKRWHQLLVENEAILTEKISAVVLRLMNRHKEEIFDKLLEELEEMRMADFADTLLMDTLEKQILSYCQGADGLFVEHLQALLQSPTSLGAVLPESAQNAIYQGICRLLDAKTQELLVLLQDDGKLKEIVAGFAKPFTVLLEKNLDEQLSHSQIEALKTATGNYVVKILQSSEMRDIVSDWLEKKIGQELVPERSIGDLFDGMFIQVLQQNAEFILQSILSAAKVKLKENRELIQRDIYELFRQNSGTVGLIGDTLLDIEGSIYRVVDDLIADKVPHFLDKKESELEAMLAEFMNEKLAQSRIGDLGLAVDAGGIMNLADRLLASEQAADSLHSGVDRLVAAFIHVPLQQWLQIISVHTIFDLYNLFRPQFQELRLALADNLREGQAVLVQKMGVFSKTVIDREILDLSIQQVSRGIRSQELDETVQHLLKIFRGSQAFACQLKIYSDSMAENIKAKEIGELIDFAILKQDSLSVLANFLQSEKAGVMLQNTLQDTIRALLDHMNEIVSVDTKNYILTVAVKSLLDGLETHLPDIVNAISLKKVTEREINHMKPKEIEDMFQSFAGPYFRQIEAYGFPMGGLFGVLANVLEKLASAGIK